MPDTFTNALPRPETAGRASKPLATEEGTESMVLRTVFLPIDVDQELRERAAVRNTSKGNLIRQAVNEYLAVN